MTIQWSGLGPDLLIRLDRSLTEPLGVQLERELRNAIRSGRLTADERLPSSRELARELGVSRGLVQECYTQLGAEGFLSSRTGSGTRVAAATRPAAPRASAPDPPPRLDVDFLAGRPDLSSFPRADWVWAVRQVSRTAPAEAFAYGDPRGSRRLREVLAGYLRRVRGAVVDPELIVVCAGFAQGLTLVLHALRRDGVREVAFEDPGSVDRRESEWYWGAGAVQIAVDDRGVDVESLAQTGARAVVVTPAHQSPTGVVLAPERRQALVEWATAVEATIIEDDYDAEFRYDREPVGALQGLAADRVALVGTVSKSLAPAVRLGWIVCPPHLVDAVAEAKEFHDRGSPGLDQLALATLIESGRFDRHLRRMRQVYGAKRQALITALERHAPEVELHGLAAGFHAVARLPSGADEQLIAETARQRSIGLYPMSRYRWSDEPRAPELVLGFGDLSEPAIHRGIATVADLLIGKSPPASGTG